MKGRAWKEKGGKRRDSIEWQLNRGKETEKRGNVMEKNGIRE